MCYTCRGPNSPHPFRRRRRVIVSECSFSNLHVVAPPANNNCAKSAVAGVEYLGINEYCWGEALWLHGSIEHACSALLLAHRFHSTRAERRPLNFEYLKVLSFDYIL